MRICSTLTAGMSVALLMVFLCQPVRETKAVAQIVPTDVVPAGGGSRFFTPRTFDADGLEELFTRVSKFGGVAHLPAGTYRIGRTVRLAGMGPFRIEGEGYGDPFNPDKTGYQSRPTRFLWTGPAGGTMFEINGTNGPSFSHMMFDGGGKAGKLVQLTSRPGWAASNLRFERVAFCNADVGVQCGNEAGEVNSSDLVFDEAIFLRLKTGFKTLNNQSVNHHFRTSGCYAVNTWIECIRGGNVLVTGWSASSFDTILKVGSAGPFAGTYHFIGGRPEMVGLTQRYPKLVETSGIIDNADIIFETTQESGGAWNDALPRNESEAAFHITKGVTLTLRNHSHYRPFLNITGGLARSIDGRWHTDPNAPGQVTHTGGEVIIDAPRSMYAKRFSEVRRGGD